MKLTISSPNNKIEGLNSQLSDGSPLILAIDNDRDNLLLINLVLSYLNYSLVMTANIQRALSMVKRDRPDLILLGINFPGIAEIEILRQLKQAASTRSIPIVALTAILNSDYLSYLSCLGCDYCLTKPYLLEDLEKLIGELLSPTFSLIKD
ncbi:response regulator [Pleurocapsales cyanobacterium LEGE 10410]|nr:response regulator [Pleurocapsales cyanobacterium LEGE 10410]